MSWKSLAQRALRVGLQEGKKYLANRQQTQGTDPAKEPAPRPRYSHAPQPADPNAGTATSGSTTPAAEPAAYPGDYTGPLRLQYAPHPDGDADPGEIVWGWIPYQEDFSQGKDRPSLVIGRDGQYALVLMLSSKDHIPGEVGDVAERSGARWMNIGSGPWDARGRASEIRLDRVIRLSDSAMRREGAIVSRETFQMIVAEVSAV